MLSLARVVRNTRTVAFTQQLCIPYRAADYQANRLLQPRPSLSADRPRNIWFGVSQFPDLPDWATTGKNDHIGNIDDDKDGFIALFPNIVKDLIDTGRYSDVPDVSEWIEELLQYNVPGGEMNRGLALVHTYKMFCPKSELNEENLQLAYILGWCTEIFQTFQVVMDDIMDGAFIRRGNMCWFRHRDIGLRAVNDGILLEQAVYQLLKKHFKDKPYYKNILEIFHDVTMKSSIGQCLDTLVTSTFKIKKFEHYTMVNYNDIVRYKTAYCSFFLPVSLAMRMANVSKISQQAKSIMLDMGYLSQVQDDFLNCFGNPKKTGKIGNDIANGKCSWFVVVALQKANAEQKRLMEENFGINNPDNVNVIKDLYEKLDLYNIFRQYEDENYKMIRDQTLRLSDEQTLKLFFKFLEKIAKSTY